MQIELFSESIVRQGSEAPMGSSYHYVPNVHALYFGPAECARHTFPSLADDKDGSYLVIDDVQTSMGQTPVLIEQAVEELQELRPDIEAFLLCSACQTAFLGLDLEGLCRDLHAKTGRCFGHLEANRMLAENMPGPKRKNVPGGDRFHSRLSFARMIDQVGDGYCGERRGEGIFVLGEVPLAAENDLHAIARISGLSWAKSVGDCASFEDFTLLSRARVVVVDSVFWREAGDYLRDEHGMQVVYMPTSYSLAEVDAYMAELGHVLGVPLLDIYEIAERRIVAEELMKRCVSACAEQKLALGLRNVVRPYSCALALMETGVEVESVLLSSARVWHVEPDDEDAYTRLQETCPDLVDEARRQAKRAGRRRSHPQLSGEAAYWGYSSVIELCEQIMIALAKDDSKESAR